MLLLATTRWSGLSRWAVSRATVLLFLAFGLTHLSAQTEEGSIRWQYRLGSNLRIESSPAVGPDGTLYVAAKAGVSIGRLFAINAEGKEVWPQPFMFPDWVDSSPAIAPVRGNSDDGTIYVGCFDGRLYAIRPNGTQKWVFPTTATSYIYSSPAIGADGTIYFGTGDFMAPGSYMLYAVSPAGVKLWSREAGGEIESSPAVAADGTIYYGSVDNNVYARAPDGTELYRYATGGDVVASPAIGADGTVFVGSADQYLYALTPALNLKWRFSTNGGIDASPVTGADGTLYFGSADRNFYALDSQGNLKWKRDVGSTGISTAAVRADGAIIFVTDAGVIWAFNPEGGELWTRRTPNQDTFAVVPSSPVIAPDGAIYVGSFDLGRLYSIHGNGSPLSTFASWPMFRRNALHTGQALVTHPDGRLLNLSTRARGGAGSNLIAGFVLQGTDPKYYLLRAVGPTLGLFGLTDPLADPLLTLKLKSGVTVRVNNDWETEVGSPLPEAADAGGAFPLLTGSKDAALLARLAPGDYTALVESADNGTGVALAEAYDAVNNDRSSRLINLSARGQVGTGDHVLIAGLVIGGPGPIRVLVRAVGPGLAAFGVSGVLSQPIVSVYSGREIIRQNRRWTSERITADLRAAARTVGAFDLATNSDDSAMVLTLNPGAYTIQVAGADGGIGEVLVEIYAIP